MMSCVVNLNWEHNSFLSTSDEQRCMFLIFNYFLLFFEKLIEMDNKLNVSIIQLLKFCKYIKSLLCFCHRDLRFMCCFRFKLWWMTQRMGTCGKDVPLETQFMLVESKDNSESDQDDGPTIYTAFLPLLEGQFRSALQGNENNEIEICLESGE